MQLLEFISLKQKVNHLHTNLQKENKVGPFLPIMLEKILLKEKGCSGIYKIIQKRSENVLQEIRRKWENIPNVEIRLDDIKKGFSNFF